MTSNSKHSPYAAASRVPLIKSPSLRIPQPVEMPLDIHPLPDDVNAYFVYPFTLEPHVVTVESSRRATVDAHNARRDAYLKTRDDEKARRKREALRRIAPGFEPEGAPLVPTRVVREGALSPGLASALTQASTSNPPPRNVMDDLVDQLAALESAAESKS